MFLAFRTCACLIPVLFLFGFMCMLYLFLKDLLLDASVSCHRFDFKNSFIAIKLFLVMMLNLFLDLKVKRGVKV